jgi:hypothetical protein
MRNQRIVAHQHVKRNHRYHFTLSTGTYNIVAQTFWGKCVGAARIRPSRTTSANAYCVFH